LRRDQCTSFFDAMYPLLQIEANRRGVSVQRVDSQDIGISQMMPYLFLCPPTIPELLRAVKIFSWPLTDFRIHRHRTFFDTAALKPPSIPNIDSSQYNRFAKFPALSKEPTITVAQATLLSRTLSHSLISLISLGEYAPHTVPMEVKYPIHLIPTQPAGDYLRSQIFIIAPIHFSPIPQRKPG